MTAPESTPETPQDAPPQPGEPTTPEPAMEAVVDPQAPDLEEPDDGTDPRISKARQEAKGLRTRLRDTEARAEQTSTALVAMQRAEAARLATGGEGLADGTDLWAHGIELDAVLAEDGTVDPEKVREAVAVVRDAHPAWAHRLAPPPSARSKAEGTSWFDMLRDRGDMAGAISSLAPGTGGTPEPTGWAQVIQGR